MRNLSSGGEKVMNSLARDRNKPAGARQHFLKSWNVFLIFPRCVP